MKRFTKRLSSRRKLTAIIAAGVLAASAAVVTTTTLAQNRPDRNGGGGTGYDRRDRGTGNGGYGNGNDRQRPDRQGGNFDRQSFDRSRQLNTTGGSRPPGFSSSQAQPAVSTAATQASTAPAVDALPPPPVVTVTLKPSDYSRKYTLLDQKNIFSKTRRAPRPPGVGSEEVSHALRPPEEMHVLRGTKLQLEDGRRVAFVENLSNNTTTLLTPGASILSGKITEVGGDYITYEADAGHQTRIEIGHNFAGSVATTGFTPSYSSGSSGSFTVSGSASASSGAAPPDLNNPNLSVEERMKLRRAQEQKPQ